jgi:CRP/FNR family transcriptional regulator
MASFASQQTFVSHDAAEQTSDATSWDSTEDEFAGGRGLLRALQPQQVLFRAGEERAEFYRVEAGILHISKGDSLAVSELAYPGEFLGLGFLSQHSSSAAAMVPSTVSCFSLSELDEIEKGSLDLRLQRANAVQREFNQVRDACVARSVQSSLVQKVANLLVVISHLDEHEGRKPNIESDGLDCEVLAQLLKLDIVSLSKILKKLKQSRLVDWCPEFGVRVTDRRGLEAFCNSIPADDPVQKVA